MIDNLQSDSGKLTFTIANTRVEISQNSYHNYHFIGSIELNKLEQWIKGIKIARLEPPNPVCAECNGDGFIIKGGAEHHPQCVGNCEDYGCPFDGRYQEQCPECNGTGTK